MVWWLKICSMQSCLCLTFGRLWRKRSQATQWIDLSLAQRNCSVSSRRPTGETTACPTCWPTETTVECWALHGRGERVKTSKQTNAENKTIYASPTEGLIINDNWVSPRERHLPHLTAFKRQTWNSIGICPLFTSVLDNTGGGRQHACSLFNLSPLKFRAWFCNFPLKNKRKTGCRRFTGRADSRNLSYLWIIPTLFLLP